MVQLYLKIKEDEDNKFHSNKNVQLCPTTTGNIKCNNVFIAKTTRQYYPNLKNIKNKTLDFRRAKYHVQKAVEDYYAGHFENDIKTPKRLKTAKKHELVDNNEQNMSESDEMDTDLDMQVEEANGPRNELSTPMRYSTRLTQRASPNSDISYENAYM